MNEFEQFKVFLDKMPKDSPIVEMFDNVLVQHIKQQIEAGHNYIDYDDMAHYTQHPEQY